MTASNARSRREVRPGASVVGPVLALRAPATPSSRPGVASRGAAGATAPRALDCGRIGRNGLRPTGGRGPVEGVDHPGRAQPVETARDGVPLLPDGVEELLQVVPP